MNKSQLKKLIQEIALQEIKIAPHIPRFKVIIPDPTRTPDPTHPAGITYTSISGDKITGDFQDDNWFVTPFPPNPVRFGVVDGETYEPFLEMLRYLDQNQIPYNKETDEYEGDEETYISVSFDNLKKRNLVQTYN